MRHLIIVVYWSAFLAPTLAYPAGGSFVNRIFDRWRMRGGSGPCQTLSNSLPTPQLATGYQATLVATGLETPRQLIFDTKGRLLVLDRGVGVKQFRVDNCGLLTEGVTIIPDTGLNHGLTITPDGQTLFASTSDAAYAWAYNPWTGQATGKTTLVTGMASGGHTTRSLLVPKANPDLLIISVGSDGNLDEGTTEYSSGRSQIRGFQWKDLVNNPVVFKESGVNFGWGLRNSVGIRDDSKGQLWSVENSADNIGRNGDDIHNDNPAEELNFHGSVVDISAASGSNHGYPVCFAAWDPSIVPDWAPELRARGQQFSLNPSSSISDQDCAADFQAPRLAFPAHTAPLDIVFDKDGNAWVSLHGSWNRSPPIGYQLITIPFDSTTSQPTAESSSDTGFTTIMSNPNVNNCPGQCFRPTSLAVSWDGSLFMSSDSTGEIYRIQKTSS
ncbi:hypothetical protein Dda_5286 [Drechslerella dactyloides]|uniref:Pyrroloquinoline quinone-dependent pyranose dehydrogenase beta-propeller domain-containing protein n=1 Tax=Drechslerella dactyloides TaxID=74499 RepID=A0AAD6IVZ2_DREDA|nr:hypothetical protein Dda_5286 [Drechslerella dactyloides]